MKVEWIYIIPAREKEDGSFSSVTLGMNLPTGCLIAPIDYGLPMVFVPGINFEERGGFYFFDKIPSEFENAVRDAIFRNTGIKVPE